MIHDDSATPSGAAWMMCWHRGSDAALRQVPEAMTVIRLGAQPGEQVYVIPQTETKGVVWPGWTTQDPGLVQKTPRGVPSPRKRFRDRGSSRCTWKERELLKAHAGFVGSSSTSRRIYMG